LLSVSLHSIHQILGRTVVAGEFQYSSGETELYDLANDPYELENISGTVDPTLVAYLKGKLEALRGCAGRTCREAENAPLQHTRPSIRL